MKVLSMTTAARLAVLVGSVALLSGCMGRIFPNPAYGRTQSEQILLSATIDEAVNNMTQRGLDPLTGKRVFVKVRSLEEDVRAVDEYVRMTVEHRLGALGVAPVENEEEADIVFLVRTRVAGIDRSYASYSERPLFIVNILAYFFLYEKLWCGADLDAQAIDKSQGRALLPSRPSGHSSHSMTQWAFLPILFADPIALRYRSSSIQSPIF